MDKVEETVAKRNLYGFRALDCNKIREYANNLSKEGLISKFQFGKIYRGWDGEQELTVKIWTNDVVDGENGRLLLLDELLINYRVDLKGRPKPIGYCDDENKPSAIIYDLSVMDTLHNLIPSGDFSWRDRIKVALGIALTIKAFHAVRSPFIIRNISAAHIMCEKDYTPWICDFGLITNGGLINPMRYKYDGQSGYPGYVDPYFIDKGSCSVKTDVYAYGVLLLCLITKRVLNDEVDEDPDFLRKWAEEEFNLKRKPGTRRPTLVDLSLKSDVHFDPKDGRRITLLAMQCIKYDPDDRPKMDEVVRTLRGLNVVENHINESVLNESLERHLPKA